MAPSGVAGAGLAGSRRPMLAHHDAGRVVGRPVRRRRRPQGRKGVVRSVLPDVVTADEFPLSRVNDSEDLDLDYLSGPLSRRPHASS
jgi:hypothetical protein